MEPCHISFGSSLDGEGAAIPLLLDQLVPSFARYDLQVPITGPRFFPAGFEEEEASFVYTSQESTWTRLSSQCVSGASQRRSRRTKRRRARRQREPMALSIKSETERSGRSCLSGLAAQAVTDPQSVEEQALEAIQDLEVEASPNTLAQWSLDTLLTSLQTSCQDEDTWRMLHGSFQDLHHISRKAPGRMLTVATANVTQWRSEVRRWATASEVDVLMLQELHLAPSDLKAEQAICARAGRDLFGSPSPVTSKHGRLGGFGVLVKNHLGARFVHNFETHGRGFHAVAVRVHRFDLVLVSVYLQSGVGIQSPVNVEVIGHLLSMLNRLSMVWLVMGDWNVPLDETQSTNIVDQVKGRFVGPSSPTGGASALDYGLLHGSLHLDTMVAWNVPFRPHALVSTTLDVGDMANIYLGLVLQSGLI